MSNVLAESKRQQVLALGRLGWSLRRIERATGVRREKASGYLKAAGVVVRGRGRPGARPANPAISSEVSTDSSPAPVADTGTGDAAPAYGDQPRDPPRAQTPISLWQKSAILARPDRSSFVHLTAMAMGKRPAARQASPMWVDTADLPTSDGHPFLPPQQNLWVGFGSGRSPSAWYRASSSTALVRKP